MIEKIKAALGAAGCDTYIITDTRTEGWDFYFIRHDLDQNRVRHVNHIQVTVYLKSDDGQYLGSASGEIAPTADDSEIQKTCRDLIGQAALVKNPFYTLKEKVVLPQADAVAVDPAAISKAFIEAAAAVPETADADMNSYEIFVNRITKRIVTSSGTDETFVYPSSLMEVVTNARRDDHEIELYRMYASGTCDAARLTDDICRTLQYGVDRLQAVPTPGDLHACALVLSTDAAVAVYDYFLDRLCTDLLVRKLSDWEIGKPVAETIGDTVTMQAVRTLENSSTNYPIDTEGSPVLETVLLEKNVPKHFWGGRQFSQYYGLSESSQVYNVVVSGGTKTADALRTGDYLEVVEFSDFQVDSMSGDIAGEIRLGYLHRDGRTMIVTGGSVSGNMTDCVKELYLSSETVQYNNRVIPAVTRLEHVNLTGC